MRNHESRPANIRVEARTEELRPSRGTTSTWPASLMPFLRYRHPSRCGGLYAMVANTKTKKSRRTLALPLRGANALRQYKEAQSEVCGQVGTKWQALGIVFSSQVGTALDAANVRRAFRRIIKAAGLNPAEWTPRELRHSFVSLLSEGGVSLEDIAELCGHAGTRVTEAVYRHQLRPVLLNGATAMDRIFDTQAACINV